MEALQAFRVDEATFNFICNLCRHQLQRVGTNYRESLSVENIVAIGLYKLAHGLKYSPLEFQFGVGKSTAQQAVKDFNRAVWAHKSEFIGWKNKSETLQFFQRKGFPGCLGAIDGCHIPIQKPWWAGGAYYCHKGFNSIVLQGVVDENRRFCSVDIGNPGRNHDAQTYKTSQFFRMAEGNFGLGSNYTVKVSLQRRHYYLHPYVLGDPAYPISRWLIKGYSGNQVAERKDFAYFTYRQSSARMKVEQAFGILKVRWQRFQSPHKAKVRHHVEAVGAACVLHNICIDRMGRAGLREESALLREDVDPVMFEAIRQPQGKFIETDPNEGEDEGVIHARNIKNAGETTRTVLTKLLTQDRGYEQWPWTVRHQ